MLRAGRAVALAAALQGEADYKNPCETETDENGDGENLHLLCSLP